MNALRLAQICSLLSLSLVFGQQHTSDSICEEAAKSFEQGRLADAEAALAALLEKQPRDARALSLMGVVLDSGQRYREAESFYRRALELAPRSVALLNNAANHYLASGNPQTAEGLYRRVVAIDASHPNANLHLAEMSVAGKRGAEALARLSRLPAGEQAAPVAQLLRGQALALDNQCDRAAAILAKLEEGAGGDSSFSFSIGLAYASCKRYEPAERSFARALQADPKNFDVLYNLGLVARHAGHLDRARQLFEIALEQRPDEPDALYALAEVLAETGNKVMATAVLYRLQKSAPDRADVPLLLAHTTEELGYFEETAASYGRYLKLRPGDQLRRRERAFALVRAGRTEDALPELRRYVLGHARDPVAQYELATAEAFTDPEAALSRLDQTLILDPELFQARYARAVLNFQQERPARAVADFQFLLERNPNNPQLLDWLGRAFLLLDRAEEAAGFLKRALDRAPRDRAILMHYSSALRRLNRREELAAVLAAFKQAASSSGERQPRRGLFDFLELPPEKQRARYIEALQTAVAANPEDAALKIRWAKALLAQGRTAEATAMFRDVLALDPETALLADCGRTLLEYEEYALAAQFLKPVPGARLDLAIAVFHSVSPQAGLAQLDEIPMAERKGDYHLLRAQILDALGRAEEAADSLNRGIHAAPTRAGMYIQAAVFLVKHGRRAEAARMLADATRLLPDASELLLTRAIVLGLLLETDEALKLLAQIQSRWPEWDRPYLISGIILETSLKSAEAIPMLETAIALGAHDADAYYYRALAIRHAAPERLDEAQKAISQAVALNPGDAEVQMLAGNILLDRQDYKQAVERLTAAIHIEPASVRAHYLLCTAYRELGEPEKSAAEAREVERITRENPDRNRTPSPIERQLFSVRPHSSGLP
jgi:tetratricopeptide (TPR) repeat protein